MAEFNVTWEFRENNGASFNETYSVIESTIARAAALGSRLAAARLALLDPLNTFLAVRAAAVDATRVTTVAIKNFIGTSPGGSGPLPVGASIILNLGGATGGSRRLWMRGGSGGDYLRDAQTGRDKVTASLNSRITEFIAALADAKYGIRTLVKPDGNQVKYQQITSIDGATVPGQAILTLDAPPPFAVNDNVIISQTSKKDYPALAGVFRVLKIAGALVTIKYRTPGDAIHAGQIGRIKKQSFNTISVINPNASGFRNFGTRASKNPLSSSRGARRAARLRNLA